MAKGSQMLYGPFQSLFMTVISLSHVKKGQDIFVSKICWSIWLAQIGGTNVRRCCHLKGLFLNNYDHVQWHLCFSLMKIPACFKYFPHPLQGEGIVWSWGLFCWLCWLCLLKDVLSEWTLLVCFFQIFFLFEFLSAFRLWILEQPNVLKWVWRNSCTSRYFDLLKLFPHTSQLCCWWSWWILLYSTRLLAWMKNLLQLMQTNGFSPSWCLWCTFRWLSCLKFCPNVSQEYSFSPECVL